MQPLQYLTTQYQLLSDWYLSVLDNIDDSEGVRAMGDNTNSLEWIAGHLNAGRYRSISLLGVKIEPYKYLDKFVNQAIPPPNAIPFDKTLEYPHSTESIKQWKEYSHLLMDALKSVDESVLKTQLPFTVLTGGNTVMDALVFIVMH